MLIEESISRFVVYLKREERSVNTIKKYTADVTAFARFLGGAEITQDSLIKYKQSLCERYKATGVNSRIAAVNGFLRFIGKGELALKPLKIQRNLFADADRELSREEYIRLVRAAKNSRISLVIQTICSTGIRVSELRFITAEAVYSGRAEIASKGKRRTVFLPQKLRTLLKRYLRHKKITAGAVFVTRRGNPLDRSNIWREMKSLCSAAHISAVKVFPHNLRHLFARCYYSKEKDLSRLADILGHSGVSTTRIYTMESGYVHAKQIDSLGLIVNTT